jgi:hypothetical protein
MKTFGHSTLEVSGAALLLGATRETDASADVTAAEAWREALAEPSEARGAQPGAAEQSQPVAAQTGQGQLMAAAHAVASYWLAGAPVALLNQVAGEIAPRGGGGLAVRLNYVTPEGGQAAAELSHPDLGALAIEVSLTGRTLRVLVTATSDRAAAALREGEEGLAMRLAEQGIALHSLDVVVVRKKARPSARAQKPLRQES